MTEATRLKIGKELYERGEVQHPYAVEYKDKLLVSSWKPEAQKEPKKSGKKKRK